MKKSPRIPISSKNDDQNQADYNVQLQRESDAKEHFENIVKSMNSFVHADVSSWQSILDNLKFSYNSYLNQETSCQGVRDETEKRLMQYVDFMRYVEKRVITVLGDLFNRDSDLVMQALEDYKDNKISFRDMNATRKAAYELMNELCGLCWGHFPHLRPIQDQNLDESKGESEGSSYDLSGTSCEDFSREGDVKR